MMNSRVPIPIEIGSKLPDWAIETIFGEKVPVLKDLQGKPLLIVFFSLGCPSCLGRAIPYANRVVYETKGKFNVVGIHTDFHQSGYDFNQLSKAKKEFFIRFPFYSDQEFDKTFRVYGAGGTPHWMILDSEGILKYSLFGSDPNNALLKLDYKIAEILVERNKNKIDNL